MKQIFTLLFCCCLLTFTVKAQIVITEIAYNNIGFDDFEFIELYNNADTAVQMEGYYFEQGVDFIFPAYTFEPGTFLIIAEHIASLTDEYGVDGFSWSGGSLSSNGEDIALLSSLDVVVDYVDYEPEGPWPVIADGFGPSLSLCDFDSDNEDPASWSITVDTDGVKVGNGSQYLTPGTASTCPSGPVVASSFNKYDLIEGVDPDSSFLNFRIEGSNGSPTTVTLAVDPSSTADASDYTMSATSLTFSGAADTVLSIILTSGTDDTDSEAVEDLVLNVSVDNAETLLYDQITYKIYDNDLESSGSLILAGIFNSRSLLGTEEFGVELYALKDIPDLSQFGIGTANNGGGTDGVEIQLPAVSLSQGDSYFVSDNVSRFNQWFGFDPDYTHASIWVTGNDAFELYENGLVIDTYAPIDVDFDGDGMWDFEEGSAQRLPETLPDGNTPNFANWLVNGALTLVGETNISATIPYSVPFYFFTPSATKDISEQVNLQLLPNPTTDYLMVNFENQDGIEIEGISIFNAIGEQVRLKNLAPGTIQTSFNVADLANGIYYLRLQTENGIASKRFLKI